MTESSTPVVDMIRRLLSHGLSRDNALEEAAIFEATLSKNTTSRGSEFDKRQYERDRKAKQREAKRQKVPDIVPDKRVNALSILSSSNNRKLDSRKNIPKTELSGTNRDTTAPPPPAAASTKRGASLPETWAPDERDIAYAAKLNLTFDEMGGLAEDMRLWARANANRAIGRKADWRSTFHGWMRREAPKIIRQRVGGSNASNRNGGSKVGFSGLAAKLRQDIRETELFDRGYAPEDLEPINRR
jgi:hypothetical protein